MKTSDFHISDQKLLELCSRYGKLALHYRRKFIGLLPEVNRRKLFKKKGFESIFEFAAKLAGISQDQVRRVLNLEERFVEMPVLKKALITGEVSMNKMARVASIASPENQRELLFRMKVLSNRAVETLVRDEKCNGLFEAKSEVKSVHVHKLELSEEVTAKLSELQEKGIDVNEMIMEFLRKRENEIEAEKVKLIGVPAKSRYVSVKVKEILKKEYGDRCAIPCCNKQALVIHHTARFSLTGNHYPRFLAPLCREHHEIAHSIDRRFFEMRR